MSVYAQAAEQPKQEETITVVAAPAAQESTGTGADYRGKQLRHGDQNRYPIEKTPQSVSVVTRQEMEMRQPTTVKAL